ncbi:MAG: o-succinylbenzoate synthase [Prevotella sp.]|nr:o-succinylbenzoate synthase [Prevotella sp.]
MRTQVERRTFHFRFPAGTSRGIYTTRTSWMVTLTDDKGRCGVGECAPLPQLSCDDLPDYDEVLKKACQVVEATGDVPVEQLHSYPSVLFGLETAMLHLRQQSWALFDTSFSRGEEGITINGLVWMGTFDEMQRRMEEKLQGGFQCVKLKIGAIDFDQELSLIKILRRRFSRQVVELRVDANGAFAIEEAPLRLEQLARYDIHSIEQPIPQGQWQEMAALCRNTPLPIALDEELIGVNSTKEKEELLDTIRPQYIILKPSLHGGMVGSEEWITMAQQRGIGSWMTSALESNIGLNAIAHLAAHLYGPHITLPQGLGTGQLFTDNIDVPLHLKGDRMWFSCCNS